MWTIVGGAVFAVAVAAVVSFGSPHLVKRLDRMQIDDETQRVEAYREKLVIDSSKAIEDRKRAEADKKAQMQPACVVGIDEKLTRARKALTAKNPDAAVAELRPCDGFMEKLEAVDLLKKSIAAMTAKDARDRVLKAQADVKERARIVANEKADRKRSGVKVGMSKQEVPESSWGKPTSIHSTTSVYGSSEQWVYPGYRNYLYFQDGILTTVQN